MLLFSALDAKIPDNHEHRAILVDAQHEYETAEPPPRAAADSSEESEDESDEGSGDDSDDESNEGGEEQRKKFRMNGRAFLMTYNIAVEVITLLGLSGLWDDFASFVQAFVTRFAVFRYSFSMEESTRSADKGRVHFHLFAQWRTQIDWKDGKSKVKWELKNNVAVVNPDIRPNFLTVTENLDAAGTKAPRGSTVQASLDMGRPPKICRTFGG